MTARIHHSGNVALIYIKAATALTDSLCRQRRVVPTAKHPSILGTTSGIAKRLFAWFGLAVPQCTGEGSSSPRNRTGMERFSSRTACPRPIAWGEVPALRPIDLDICEGEFIVLLGPSGSGKSILLNILGGLDAPTSGQAFFRDHALVGADERELTRYCREHVGFAFQFYNLIPCSTAWETLCSSPRSPSIR